MASFQRSGYRFLSTTFKFQSIGQSDLKSYSLVLAPRGILGSKMFERSLNMSPTGAALMGLEMVGRRCSEFSLSLRANSLNSVFYMS